jgi:exodeoxyribonuclease-3
LIVPGLLQPFAMPKTIIKIVSWNVNSIRARLGRAVAWLKKHEPDVLCIQESKVEDALFPRAEFEALGYRCELYGQKTYNGVAILSKHEAADVRKGLADDGDCGQRRLIAATIGGIRIVNVYVPNGESVDSEKFIYKKEWLRKLEVYLKAECKSDRPLLLLGDFNIAPEDRDVHDPALWRGKVLFHPEEHAALRSIMALGFDDALRLKHDEAGLYTWWDFRTLAFQRGNGLRIDLLLTNRALSARCRDVWIDREERKGEKPSDHAPVVGEFEG